MKTLFIEDGVKKFRSPDYNYNFRLSDGFFQRWGSTIDEDPDFSPYSPEIADIEISYGDTCRIKCPFCYKGNGIGGEGTNMSLETFKSIFEKFPKINGQFILTQVALGITSITENKDFFPICDYLRNNSVIPNVTINGADPLTDEEISRLVKTVGAMAISISEFNYKKGYDLINRIIQAGGQQINIHYVVSKQSYKFVFTLLNDRMSNPLLKGINAIVFLSLKPKNRGQDLDVLPEEDFHKIIRYCLDNSIAFGADSCSAHKVLRSFTPEEFKKLKDYIEPCEASKFSFYINADGKHYPCSFLEDEPRDIWPLGIYMGTVIDFVKEIWNHPSVLSFRDSVNITNKNCNNCCHFKI
jgi:radical SAM protein with 4Fe4S-binding SPASM domain